MISYKRRLVSLRYLQSSRCLSESKKLEWLTKAKKELGHNPELWMTPENIQVKPLYTKDDIEGIDPGYPGCEPYTRGVYATMYTAKP